MTTALIVTIVGLTIASTVQSATGFGFSLIAGPTLFTVLDAAEAVTLLMVIGQVVNLLVLFGERRRPVIDWAAIRPALVAAVPGLPIGALIVRLVPMRVLRLATGVLVCALVMSRLLRRRPAVDGDDPSGSASAGLPGRRQAHLAGLAVGVLTTSTTTTGPPLAIWLTARRMPPAQIRDVVTMIFFILDLIALPLFVGIVGSADGLAKIGWIPLLIPAACSVTSSAVGCFFAFPSSGTQRSSSPAPSSPEPSACSPAWCSTAPPVGSPAGRFAMTSSRRAGTCRGAPTTSPNASAPRSPRAKVRRRPTGSTYSRQP